MSKWFLRSNVSRDRHGGRISCFLLSCVVFQVFASNICIAEDLNHVQLANPIRYENKYTDENKNTITSILDVEEGESGKIKFSLMTVVRSNVCELSGEALLRQQESERRMRTYRFDYEKCHLSLQQDNKNRTIRTSDPDGACASYVCGQSGEIDGFIFNLKK
jgi:hypothetical protein